MKIDGKWYRYYADNSTRECINHSYAWSGDMPCTGVYRCVFCGKPKDEGENDTA